MKIFTCSVLPLFVFTMMIGSGCSSTTNHRDSAAIHLANRFMCMAGYVSQYGDAKDKLQWAVAVNVMLDTFRVAEPSVPSDSVLDEIERVIERFSSQTMREAYFQSSVASTVDYYLAIEACRKSGRY
jgi:hypothetical protein